MKHVLWFGDPDRSLFGVLEHPDDGEARGGVVVVAPLGIEQVTTHRGLRFLAESLVRKGFAVLRHDHPGTGSSVGETLADDNWTRCVEAVGEAVRYLRSAGTADITLVGVHAGCLIADAFAHAAPDLVDRLVYWDPPRSGRRYLRESTTLHRLTAGTDPTDPGVSVAGGHFSHTTAAALGSARFEPLPGVPKLVAARREVLAAPECSALVGGAAVLTLAEAEPFTAPEAFVHHVPARDVAAIVRHVDAAAPRTTSPVSGYVRTTAVVARRPDGTAITETITRETARNLVTMTTRAEDDDVDGGIVFLGTANEPAWGPCRAWVEAARENAGNGLLCVRFDKTDTGETGTIDPDGIAVLYSRESREDAVEVVRGLGIAPADLLAVGLCSGAWIAARTAPRTGIGQLVLFGMIRWSPRGKAITAEVLRAAGYDLATQRSAPGSDRLPRLKALLGRILPLRVWESLGRRGLLQSPGPLLTDLHAAGIRTTVALTPEDDAHFVAHRGDASLRRLRRRGFAGEIRRIDVPTGDHDLHRPDSRTAAAAIVRDRADDLRRRLGRRVVGGRRPLRVLFVNENIGGHRTVHESLRRALVGRRDVEVEFLDARPPGFAGRVLRAPIPGLARFDLDLQPLRSMLVHSAGVRRRVGARLRRGDLDAMHVYTQNCMLGGSRLVRSLPTVISTDSTILENSKSIPYRRPTRMTPCTSRAGLPWERPVLRAAHHVIANSRPAAASLASEDYGLPADRLSLLEMGIWSPHLTEPIPERDPGRRPTIVFVGTSMERKGGARLLDLWRRHLRDRADLLLVTLDDVPREPGLTVVRDLRPGDDRLWGLLADSDVFCFPSLIDQAPNAVLEASASGLPVVAHPRGAIPRMVIDGVTGILVPERDDAALVEALTSLLADPDLRRRLGDAGARHIRENYDIRRSVDGILRILGEAVREGTR